VKTIELNAPCGDSVLTMTDENKVLMASLGGVELVLSALRNHSSHVSVQASGLRGLTNLAVNGSLWVCVELLLNPACGDSVLTMTDENEVLIASLGGVELVLSALRNHSSHASVQASGLRALTNLAVNGSLWVCVEAAVEYCLW